MTFKTSEWFSPDMEFPPQKKTNLHNIAEIMWHSNMVNFNCLNYKINRIFKELINTCTWF
jgi:hypothetical protein